MNPSGNTRLLARLWMLVIAVVAIAVLYMAKILFLPLAFAILFAFLLTPAVMLLERCRLPRALAAVLVLLGFVAILGTAAWMLFTQLVSVANDLPTYRDNIAQKVAAIHSPSNSAFSRAEREVERLSDEFGIATTSPSAPLPTPGQTQNKSLGTSPSRPVQVHEVARNTGRLDQLGGFLEPLATALLSIVFTFFVILEREDLRNRLIRLSGDRNLTVLTQAMDDASGRISRYFSLLLTVNLLYGAVIAAVLTGIGLPHALLFGALATLFRFAPYVGWPIAAALPTLLSLAVFHGWTRSLLIIGAFLCIELITANFAEPRIYGKHTGLSPLAILIAAAFWTLLWGPVGLVLSVPLTVCLVVMGRHIPSLEFLSVMLGDQAPMPAWTCLYQRLLARDEREAAEILENNLADQPLESAYDSVLIPALVMSEEERLHSDLEDSTVQFIRQAAREMIEEFGFRANSAAERGAFLPLPATPPANAATTRVMCIPVRDEMDELAALMLAQVLDSERIEAFATPVQRLDQILARAAEQKPDIVFIAGLPPFGIARSHRLYRNLRARNPELKIMIGIWNYRDNTAEAAQKISRAEDLRIYTSLTDAAHEVRSIAGVPDTTSPEESATAADESNPTAADEKRNAA